MGAHRANIPVEARRKRQSTMAAIHNRRYRALRRSGMKPEDEAPELETSNAATKDIKQPPFAFGASGFGQAFGITQHDMSANEQLKEGEE